VAMSISLKSSPPSATVLGQTEVRAMMKIRLFAVLVAVVLAVGCGGGNGSGYLSGTGCSELEYTAFSWDTWGWGWQCKDKGYSATCQLEHFNNGVNITCYCIVSEGTSFDGKGGKIFSKTSWNDSQPPKDPYEFVEYIQKIPQCSGWSPPF
jgi:hypothetical protein